MVKLSDLVVVVSRLTALPMATVFAYGRFAREAGLIAQKGRGRGAATMGLTDATNLLIAICGTDVTREAARVIQTLRPLRGYLITCEHEELVNWLAPLKVKKGIFVEVDCGAFLEFLIQAATSGRLLQVLTNFKRSVAAQQRLDERDLESYHLTFDLIFDRTEDEVSLECSFLGALYLRIIFRPPRRRSNRDFIVTARVSYITLVALGRVLEDTTTKQKGSEDGSAQILRLQHELRLLGAAPDQIRSFATALTKVPE